MLLLLWYRRSFFEEKFNSVTTDNSISYNLNHICFDIDKEIDFLFMDYLIINNLLDLILLNEFLKKKT